MFVQQIPFWEKAIRTVAVYALIAARMRTSRATDGYNTQAS